MASYGIQCRGTPRPLKPLKLLELSRRIAPRDRFSGADGPVFGQVDVFCGERHGLGRALGPGQFVYSAHDVKERARSIADNCAKGKFVIALQTRARCAYIGSAGLPAMAINTGWNRRYGPGGSARRLHHQRGEDLWREREDRPRCCWGRTRIDVRSKGSAFARHGTAVIGPNPKCQR